MLGILFVQVKVLETTCAQLRSSASDDASQSEAVAERSLQLMAACADKEFLLQEARSQVARLHRCAPELLCHAPGQHRDCLTSFCMRSCLGPEPGPVPNTPGD